MNIIIQTCSRGGGIAPQIEHEIHKLRDEFSKEEIEFRSLFLESTTPIPELLISIIGGLSVVLITKLIDRIVDGITKVKKKNDSRVNIFLIHKEFNIKFRLPEQKAESIEYFKKHLADHQGAKETDKD